MLKKLTVSKYYTDCIDAHGNIFIGYIGVVNWKNFRFDYSNYLNYDASKGVFNADYAINKHAFPDWAPPQLKWHHDALHIEGVWHSLQNPIEETLFEDDATSIKWSCIQPLSDAEVHLNGVQINGLGYTERLDLQLNPLHLPFDSIRWGRFAAPDTSIVWIEWQGEIPKNLVFVNDVKYENVSISDELIQIPDAHLELQLTESLELRKGSLLDTVFKNLQWLKQFFPLKMLTTYECKWRSKGTLIDTTHSKSIIHGWSIHEIVLWK